MNDDYPTYRMTVVSDEIPKLCKQCGKSDHGTVACICLISPIIRDWDTPKH